MAKEDMALPEKLTKNGKETYEKEKNLILKTKD